MSDYIRPALLAAFPEPEDTLPPIHEVCGLPYARFDLLNHLQNECPNPPFKEDVLAARAYRSRRGGSV